MYTNRVGTDGKPIAEVDAENHPMSVLSELLGCPFCGGTASIFQVGGQRWNNRVGCDNAGCGANLPHSFTSIDTATKVWNRRAILRK